MLFVAYIHTKCYVRDFTRNGIQIHGTTNLVLTYNGVQSRELRLNAAINE